MLLEWVVCVCVCMFELYCVHTRIRQKTDNETTSQILHNVQMDRRNNSLRWMCARLAEKHWSACTLSSEWSDDDDGGDRSDSNQTTQEWMVCWRIYEHTHTQFTTILIWIDAQVRWTGFYFSVGFCTCNRYKRDEWAILNAIQKSAKTKANWGTYIVQQHHASTKTMNTFA